MPDRERIEIRYPIFVSWKRTPCAKSATDIATDRRPFEIGQPSSITNQMLLTAHENEAQYEAPASRKAEASLLCKAAITTRGHRGPATVKARPPPQQ